MMSDTDTDSEITPTLYVDEGTFLPRRSSAASFESVDLVAALDGSEEDEALLSIGSGSGTFFADLGERGSCMGKVGEVLERVLGSALRKLPPPRPYWSWLRVFAPLFAFSLAAISLFAWILDRVDIARFWWLAPTSFVTGVCSSSMPAAASLIMAPALQVTDLTTNEVLGLGLVLDAWSGAVLTPLMWMGLDPRELAPLALPWVAIPALLSTLLLLAVIPDEVRPPLAVAVGGIIAALSIAVAVWMVLQLVRSLRRRAPGAGDASPPIRRAGPLGPVGPHHIEPVRLTVAMVLLVVLGVCGGAMVAIAAAGMDLLVYTALVFFLRSNCSVAVINAVTASGLSAVLPALYYRNHINTDALLVCLPGLCLGCCIGPYIHHFLHRRIMVAFVALFFFLDSLRLIVQGFFILSDYLS